MKLLTELEILYGSHINNPNWKSGGRVHNWKNHVPFEIKEAWAELSHKEKLFVIATADYAADKEEWD